MSAVAADTLYVASFVPNWGDDGPIGHVVVRRLDDRVTVAQVPVEDEESARTLLSTAEADLHGAAADFEAAWGIAREDAADPGPDVVRRDAVAPDSPRDRDGGERIGGPDGRVTVLPDAADVFVADQPWLARLLHPLVSIDLGAFDETWPGRVHLLSPVEPEDGLLGEATVEHHDDHANENWLSFRVEDDGRYRFLGSRRYFELEDLEASGAPPRELANRRELYAAADAEFEGTRTRYARVGALVWGDERDPTRQRAGWGTDIALVDQLGGEPGYGNWVATPPSAFTIDRSDPVAPVLRLADGRPFTFVAATSGYPWRHSGADAILLFFEPETRTAVLTFDWT